MEEKILFFFDEDCVNKNERMYRDQDGLEVGENNISEDIVLLNDFIEGNFQKDKLENYKGSYKMGYFYYKSIQQAIKNILVDYKKVLKENETYKKQYFGLIDKIENKIANFDYEYKKAERKNNQERADYYWDLTRNFIKILESE